MARVVRIQMKAGDSKVLDKAAMQLVDAVTQNQGTCVGPTPLPLSRKEGREGLHYHRRALDIIDPTSGLIDALMTLTMPQGVAFEIRLKETPVSHGVE